MNGYSEWKQWGTIDFGSYTAEQGRYFEVEMAALGVLAVRKSKIGELGFGNGNFAGWVRKAGGGWVGKEQDPELQRRATALGYAVIDPDVTFAAQCGAGGLDVLAAFDVLEHLDVESIRAFLRDAKVALKPGGIVVIRMPSGDSPFVGAIFWGDLTHRTLLGSSAVRQLALDSGLELFQLRPPVTPLRGLGIIRFTRRVVVLSVQGLVSYCIRTFIIGNRNAVLTPNMIVALRNPRTPSDSHADNQ